MNKREHKSQRITITMTHHSRTIYGTRLRCTLRFHISSSYLLTEAVWHQQSGFNCIHLEVVLFTDLTLHDTKLKCLPTPIRFPVRQISCFLSEVFISPYLNYLSTNWYCIQLYVCRWVLSESFGLRHLVGSAENIQYNVEIARYES